MRKPIVLLDFKVFDRIALQNHKRVNFLGKKYPRRLFILIICINLNLIKKTFKDLLKIDKKNIIILKTTI